MPTTKDALDRFEKQFGQKQKAADPAARTGQHCVCCGRMAHIVRDGVPLDDRCADDPRTNGRVLVRKALDVVFTTDSQTFEAAADEALALARDQGLTTAETNVLMNLAARTAQHRSIRGIRQTPRDVYGRDR